MIEVCFCCLHVPSGKMIWRRGKFINVTHALNLLASWTAPGLWMYAPMVPSAVVEYTDMDYTGDCPYYATINPNWMPHVG